MVIALIRTLILYVVVTTAVRWMGKRQVGELQNSELVITMLISELAAIPMQDGGTPLFSGLIPILTLVVAEILVSILMLKWKGFRRFVCGGPIVVIREGKLQQKAMRQLRLSVEELYEALRLQGIFDWKQVDTAMVETNGRLSVLLRGEGEPPDAEALGVKVDTDFWAVIVDDGTFCTRSAELCGCTAQWLQRVLKREQCSLSQVFLLTANRQQKYRLVRKE